MSNDDILFAIDGLLAQIDTGLKLAVALDQDVTPLGGVRAAAMVLRALVEADSPPVDVSGACQHPSDAVKRTMVGGGGYVLMCTACNDIIEQG